MEERNEVSAKKTEACQQTADTTNCGSDTSALAGIFGSVRRTILVVSVFIDIVRNNADIRLRDFTGRFESIH